MTATAELDHRITVGREEETGRNEWNEPIVEFVALGTFWASRQDASASEAYRAQEVGAQITTRFAVRWSPTTAQISPLYEVHFDGRVYNITAVRDSGRRRFREIDAVARAE